jgi:hypothetical protein
MSAETIMTAPATERLVAVKFTGSDPNLADVEKVRELVVGGRYEIVDQVFLPVVGKDDREKNLVRVARDRNLDSAYGAHLTGRLPADSEEAAQLVAGAPAGTGVVFHLRLKKPARTTSPTP